MKRTLLVLFVLLSVVATAQQTKFKISPDVGNLYVYSANDKLVGTFAPAATTGGINPATSVGDSIALVGDGGRLYVAPAEGTRVVFINPMSQVFRVFDDGGNGLWRCQKDGGERAVIPLGEVARLGDQFTPPFTIETTVKIRSVGVGR